MSALPISLEDKYTLASGRVYLNGTQALVQKVGLSPLSDSGCTPEH